MAKSRINISNKFKNGMIPPQEDFQEIFDSFVHKDEDKANFEMIEKGTDEQHYVTPALLRTAFQNSGIISGNCYVPYKEYNDDFTGLTISLEKKPIQYSIKVFKNGQLLQENEDYTLNHNTAIITFASQIIDRNIEIDYWYQKLDAPTANHASVIGSSYLPFKQNYDGAAFNDDTITLEKSPIRHSVWVYKNGQLLLEEKDYVVDYTTGIIKFSEKVSDRNIEVNYWYESSNSLSGADIASMNNNYVDLNTNQNISGNKNFKDATTSDKFIKSGGTSSQYLMADGSVSTTTSSDYDAGHSGFNYVSTSGYQILSNGLIFQWAYLMSGTVTYNFPLTWPNRPLSVVLSTVRDSSGSRGYNHVSHITSTSYYALIDGTYGYMFAIGY